MSEPTCKEAPYTKELLALLDTLNLHYPDLPALSLLTTFEFEKPLHGQYFPAGERATEACIWVEQWVSSSRNFRTDPPVFGEEPIARRVVSPSAPPQDLAKVLAWFLHEYSHHVDVIRNQRDTKAEKGDPDKQHDEQWKATFYDVIEWAKATKFVQDDDLRARVLENCNSDTDLTADNTRPPGN